MPRKYQKAEESIGKTYGRLTVMKVKRDNESNAFAYCVCSCGHTGWHRLNGLRTGDTLSCGCAQREAASKQGSLSKLPRPKKGSVVNKCVILNPFATAGTKHQQALMLVRAPCGHEKLLRPRELNNINRHHYCKSCSKSRISRKNLTKEGRKLFENKSSKFLMWLAHNTSLGFGSSKKIRLELTVTMWDTLNLHGIWPWDDEGYPLSDVAVRKAKRDVKKRSC